MILFLKIIKTKFYKEFLLELGMIEKHSHSILKPVTIDLKNIFKIYQKLQ